ncbi:MAG: helix-turn-helix domain-containing protein [Rhizobiales bacterium]|nr:helix-turn-helix domain-containing protein [Hyphomicrobiales bacterium]
MAKPIRAIARVIEILTYLNKHNGSNSNQVAIGTKLSRGTAYRMLETLEGVGLVDRRINEGNGYWLTGKVRQLSAGFDEESWISAVALPEIRRLGKSIVWPVMLTTPRGIEMVLRATTDSSTSLVRNRYLVGHTIPMLGSAAGRCYLAFTPHAQFEATVDLIVKMAPAPWREIAKDRRALHRLLREIRDRGVAHAQPPERGTMSLAVPIMLGDEPRAILAARYFKGAMTVEDAETRLVGPLKAAAARISDSLGRNTEVR